MLDLITEKIKEYENEYKENKEDTKKDEFESTRRIIFIIIGIMNILFADKMKERLSFFIGILSITTASISLIRNIKRKEYTRQETQKIPRDIVVIILGTIILFKKENSIPFIAIVWGISSLQRGIKLLNIALYNKVNKKPFVLKLIYSIIEIVLAILLIFNPFEKLEIHLVLLGIEMIVSSLKGCFKNKEYKKIQE